MKLSLDSIGYAGFFTGGETLPIEQVVRKAAEFGFDGVDVLPHRPMAFPMDLNQDRRKALVDLANSLDIELGAIEALTNFMRSKHILTQHQDKELLFIRECCKLASDLHISTIRIFAGFLGYFLTGESSQGYGTPAMHSRSIEVSTSDDYLREWEFVREGIREAGLIARDFGVTLALQNHPPITNNTEETIEMVEEVELDNVKIALDLPLMAQQGEDSIRKLVLKVGDRMVHSRMIGIRFRESMAGAVGFDEVVPGEGRENWPAFLRACKEIGYNGYLGYEQCSPIILKGHKKAGLDEVDRRYQAGLTYLKGLLMDLGMYSGEKPVAQETTLNALRKGVPV
jgi:sugar phosphate isomerase/epimerase